MSSFASIAQGRDTWSAHCRIPRHRHERAYAAVILSGGYQESGSRGRYRVGSGHVLLHRTFDAHIDRFAAQGAQILNLLLDEEPVFGLGCLADPEEYVPAECQHQADGARLTDRLARAGRYFGKFPGRADTSQSFFTTTRPVASTYTR